MSSSSRYSRSTGRTARDRQDAYEALTGERPAARDRQNTYRSVTGEGRTYHTPESYLASHVERSGRHDVQNDDYDNCSIAPSEAVSNPDRYESSRRRHTSVSHENEGQGKDLPRERSRRSTASSRSGRSSRRAGSSRVSGPEPSLTRSRSSQSDDDKQPSRRSTWIDVYYEESLVREFDCSPSQDSRSQNPRHAIRQSPCHGSQPFQILPAIAFVPSCQQPMICDRKPDSEEMESAVLEAWDEYRSSKNGRGSESWYVPMSEAESRRTRSMAPFPLRPPPTHSDGTPSSHRSRLPFTSSSQNKSGPRLSPLFPPSRSGNDNSRSLSQVQREAAQLIPVPMHVPNALPRKAPPMPIARESPPPGYESDQERSQPPSLVFSTPSSSAKGRRSHSHTRVSSTDGARIGRDTRTGDLVTTRRGSDKRSRKPAGEKVIPGYVRWFAGG